MLLCIDPYRSKCAEQIRNSLFFRRLLTQSSMASGGAERGAEGSGGVEFETTIDPGQPASSSSAVALPTVPAPNRTAAAAGVLSTVPAPSRLRDPPGQDVRSQLLLDIRRHNQRLQQFLNTELRVRL